MTSVEWLEQILKQHCGKEFTEGYKELFDKAKEMEEQKMYKCASFWRGKENEIEKPIFQQYYNETFKK